MKHVFTFASLVSLLASAASAQNTYVNTVLVANDAKYEPLVMVDPLLVNGWGLSLRPPGAGGHFWISNNGSGTTTTYVGDVHTKDHGFKPLFQDDVKSVELPQGRGVFENGVPFVWDSQPTGQVYNHSTTDFVVSGEGLTAASKFIFVGGDGTIAGWVELKDKDGTMRRQTRAVIMVDNTATHNHEQLVYTGCAITDFKSNNHLYVSNTMDNTIEMYDHEFKRVALPPGRFQYPVGQRTTNQVYQPWNIQYLHTGPNGEGRLWVAYVVLEDPWEEDPVEGAVGEFDLEGNFIRGLTSRNESSPLPAVELLAPWGIALAPADFGPFSNALLIANFTDGTIPAFDLKTGAFIDFLRDASGQPIAVDGVWGITFGNGVGLGDTNALYYAAGPDAETGGTFGTVRYTPHVCPVVHTQPASVKVTTGGNVAFAIDAPSPVRLKYQWQIRQDSDKWLNLTDGETPGIGLIAGASAEKLTIKPTDKSGAVRVVLTNNCGEVTSQVAGYDVVECDSIDFNNDKSLFDAQDIESLFSVFKDGPCVPATANCNDIDFNNDGNTLDQCDINSFLTMFENGPCTLCGK